MQLIGPVRYALTFTTSKCSCLGADGVPRFTGIASNRLPKLYIVSIDNWPVYVGITKQPMATRLRLGFKASGIGGYHGYAWRHQHTKADLDIWCHKSDSVIDIETVEAEVVYLIRQAGQWPTFQTEIHFRPSNAKHRECAAEVMKRYTNTK